MEDVLLFANPIAGRGRGGQIAQRLVAELTRRGYRVNAFFQRADEIDGRQLWREARAAIVIGGDGTLRTVTRRLYQCCAEGGSGDSGAWRLPPLLIVPLGTANLMGQHLGIQWDDATLAEQVGQCLARRRVVELDAASANGAMFLLVAGVGIDAFIVHELDRIRRGPITRLHYALPAGLALQQYDFPLLTVRVDGAVVCEDLPAMAFVGNIPEYGTGFSVLPLARADDGLLDVCVLPCRSRRELMQLLLLAAAGEHLSAEGVKYVKGRRIEVTSPAALPVQVDGEPAGHTPLVIDLLPHRIPFIVPEK